MKTKTFDCVEMKRKGAELVQQRLVGMNRRQQLEYWQEQTELLLKRQAASRARKTATEDSPAARG